MPLEEAIEEWCENHYQLSVGGLIEQPVMRHTFSHYHLDITPCVVEVNNPGQSVMEAERRVWYKATQNDRNVSTQALGLAKPVSHLLNSLNEE